MSRRVVVTGIGLVSPLGIGTAGELGRRSCAGQSGIGPITRFDASQFSARIAGEVKGFDPLQFIDKKDVKKMDVFIQFALAAAQFAVDDAGLTVTPEIARARRRLHRVGHRRVPHHRARAQGAARGRPAQISPFFIPRPSSTSPPARCRSASAPRARTRHLHRVLGLGARHRRRLRDHPPRRRRRDDRGRLRGGDHADGHRRVRARCARCRRATTSRRRPAGRSTRIATASSSGEGAGVVILEELEHAKRARRARSTPRSSATA